MKVSYKSKDKSKVAGGWAMVIAVVVVICGIVLMIAAVGTLHKIIQGDTDAISEWDVFVMLLGGGILFNGMS